MLEHSIPPLLHLRPLPFFSISDGFRRDFWRDRSGGGRDRGEAERRLARLERGVAMAMAMMAAEEVAMGVVGSLWSSAVPRRDVAVDNNGALRGG